MIHEEICTYEVSKLAKEKGFDWDCPMFYNPEGKLKYGWAYDPMNSRLDMRDVLCHNSKLPLGFGAECTAPTQSLLQRWLREEKGLCISVEAYPTLAIIKNVCFAWVIKSGSDGHFMESNDSLQTFYSYELALEDALKYALENLLGAVHK